MSSHGNDAVIITAGKYPVRSDEQKVKIFGVDDPIDAITRSRAGVEPRVLDSFNLTFKGWRGIC